MTETGRSSRLSPAQQADALRDEAKHDVAPALTPDARALAVRVLAENARIEQRAGGAEPEVYSWASGYFAHGKTTLHALARAYLAAEQRATEALKANGVLAFDLMAAESDRAALRARVEALRDALNVIASPLHIDGEEHRGAVYLARRVMKALTPGAPR